MLLNSRFTIDEMKSVLARCGATVASFFDFIRGGIHQSLLKVRFHYHILATNMLTNSLTK
jgi:hypothetical protein